MSSLLDIQKTLAFEIREARTRANLTQIELAAKLGVSHRAIQTWEAGSAFPHPAHRRKLARWFAQLEKAA